jgi:hypothetical protein
MGDPTVDFLCPRCGRAERRALRTLPARLEPVLPRNSPLLSPALFHVSLKCEEEDCGSHATLHTIAASLGEKILMKAVEDRVAFELDGITCLLEHPVRMPMLVVAKRRTKH